MAEMVARLMAKNLITTIVAELSTGCPDCR